MNKHTPMPWKLGYPDGGGINRITDGRKASREIIDLTNPDNAAFIVRAVNSHDDLLLGLKVAEEYLSKTHGKELGMSKSFRRTIAKAEGKEVSQ